MGLTHSNRNYLLRAYYVPGTVLAMGIRRHGTGHLVRSRHLLNSHTNAAGMTHVASEKKR